MSDDDDDDYYYVSKGVLGEWNRLIDTVYIVYSE